MALRRRWWVWILLLPVLLLTGAGGAGYWLARQAEPLYSGTVAVPDLAAPVTVSFGPHAIPYIRAASREDLFFAQGYLVASERMWQMDLIRRIARGELSEMLGEEVLAVDRLFRTLGLHRAAERNLEALSDEGRRYLEAYARGVNRWRERYAGRLPLEYRIVGIEPAVWRPADSLSVAEYMAFLLSFNAKEELVYLQLARRLGKARALELFPSDENIPAPAYARDLPDYATAPIEPFLPYLRLAKKLGLPRPGPASNTWAVAGTHTADGQPLLANDPHLMPSMPGLWYELEMKAPGYHVAGICLPGLPLVVIGHNGDLAWGMNTSMADTQDIFVERLTAAGDSVERANAPPEAIALRTEEIAVKDWPEPHRMQVRETDHGVILNDVLAETRPIPLDFVELASRELITLRWTIELPDRAFDGIYRLNTATTIAGARAAIALISHASQNILIVHRDGSIAWQMSGTLPVRGKGLGTFPAPGWNSEYGWDGYVPPGDNPGTLNPPAGMIVSANNRTIPIDYPVHVTRSWMPPYRARRIEQLLDDKAQLTVADMQAIQLDKKGLEAIPWLDALHKLEPHLRTTDPQAWKVANDMLRNWNGSFEPDSNFAALFVLLRRELFDAIYADELGDDLQGFMAVNLFAYGALQETVRTGESSFWDDVRTPGKETPADIWARALRRAARNLRTQQGELSSAQLGRLRRLTFPHAFHSIPLLGKLFRVGPVAVGGDNHTVDAVKTEINAPEIPLFIPTYRVVYTPGDWRQTRGAQPLGQSGHLFSQFRTDQLDDWLNGRMHSWSWGGTPADKVIATLRLVPE
jgi:penicillin amidase